MKKKNTTPPNKPANHARGGDKYRGRAEGLRYSNCKLSIRINDKKKAKNT